MHHHHNHTATCGLPQPGNGRELGIALGNRNRGRFAAAFLTCMMLAVSLAALNAGAASPTAPSPATPIHLAASRKSVAERVVVDLSRKETYVPLAVNADPEDVRITDIRMKDLPVSYRVVPAQGTVQLGQPVDIEMEAPGPIRIRVAVVRRGNELALRVSPQIVLSPSEILDLNQDRVSRAARAFRRRVKDLNQRLVALAREREAIQTWLASPGNKPLSEVKVARARLRIVSQELQAQQNAIPIARSHYEALEQVATFVQQLHNSAELHYRVTISQHDNDNH